MVEKLTKKTMTEEHLEKKCYKKGCEEQAEGECHGYSGSMVCGAPMCKNHKHKH